MTRGKSIKKSVKTQRRYLGKIQKFDYEINGWLGLCKWAVRKRWSCKYDW